MSNVHLECQERIAELEGRLCIHMATLSECTPYLKEGETPLQCIQRHHSVATRAMLSEANILKLYEDYLSHKRSA